MNNEQLVKMANDIGAYFSSEPDHDIAVEEIAGHIRRFWDPRMRRDLITHCNEGGSDLTDLVRAAVLTLDVPRKQEA